MGVRVEGAGGGGIVATPVSRPRAEQWPSAKQRVARPGKNTPIHNYSPLTCPATMVPQTASTWPPPPLSPASSTRRTLHAPPRRLHLGIHPASKSNDCLCKCENSAAPKPSPIAPLASSSPNSQRHIKKRRNFAHLGPLFAKQSSGM